MPWVPIDESGVAFTFDNLDGGAQLDGSVVSTSAEGVGWLISNDAESGQFRFRVAVQSYSAASGGFGQAEVAHFDWNDEAADQFSQPNEASSPDASFEPASFEGNVGFNQSLSYTSAVGSGWSVIETYAFLIEVWQDDLPPEGIRPWWLCVPKDPPEPCPVRPTTFVDFANYDPDFKFPLQSSRKPSRIVRPDGCVVCAPTLIEQVEPEPPPPICASMVVTPDDPTVFQSGEMVNAPDWFVYGDTFAFVVAFEDDWDNYYTFTWNGVAYAASGVLPFGSYDQILNMMIAIPEDDSSANFDWSCINISTYEP